MPDPHTYNEQELLLRIAEGEEKAYRELFDHHWKPLYALGLKMTKSPEQAKDMAQEVFARLWIHRTSLPALGNFEGFLYTVARNIIRDFLKKRVFNPETDSYMLQYLNASSSSPHDLFESAEKRQAVEDAISRLPPQIQRAFRLRYQDYSHDEIAQEMKISRVTSKSYIVRALELLRGYLADHTDAALMLLILFMPRK